MNSGLQTFHGYRETSALAYLHPKPAWLSVNTIYTHDSTVVAHAQTEYRRSTVPLFLIEGIYENEGVGAAGVRQQAYQAILSGSTGEVMGNRPIWLFDPRWQQALESAGSKSMSRLAAFFRSIAWWKLRPDLRRQFVTSPRGTGASASVVGRASDGSIGVVYTPTPQQLTVDLSRLTGPYVGARWYDPVSGRFSAVAGSSFRAAGRQVFVGPSANAGGDGDFVLLLQSRRP